MGVAEAVEVVPGAAVVGRGEELEGVARHKGVGEVKEGGEEGEEGDLGGGVAPEGGGVAEGGPAEVEVGEGAAEGTPEETEEEETGEFEPVPGVAVVDLEHGKLAGVGGVDALEEDGGGDTADQGLVEKAVGEEIGNLLDAENHPTDGSSEGYTDASTRGGRNEVTVFRLTVAYGGEQS